MKISEEDRKLIRKFEDIKKRGLYVQSSQLQAVYNRVFQVNLSATTCGTCLRGRTQKLVDALNKLELEEREAARKAAEAAKVAVVENAPEEAENNEVDNVPQEEKETATSEINEVQDDVCSELKIEEVKEEKDVKQTTPDKKSRRKSNRKKGTK